MPISRKQQLLSLLADGKLHPQTSLAEKLNIPPPAVTELLTDICETLDLNLTATKDQSYQLTSPHDLLNKEQILQSLSTESLALISQLEIHTLITSTNSHLVEAALNNLPSGAVCLAEAQTAGKGRLGRQWLSPFGKNIYLSILWRYPGISPAALSGISLAVGVGVIRALTAHFPQLDLNLKLKWPNDIVSYDKKLGGILIEVSTTGHEDCTAVIGLGLNLFLPVTKADAITQPWTDLTKLTGLENLRRNELTGKLLTSLLPIIANFKDHGMANFVDEWRSLDCLKDKAATLYHGNQQLTGMVRGIDDNGLLLMELGSGKIQAFASGEVSFRGTAL